jgi:hypothetical protein
VHTGTVDKNALYGAINEGVLAERLNAFERNLVKNAPHIARCGGVRGLIPHFKGKHVIVIGAGPSLDRNLPLLKKYQSRREFLLVAADMAVKPLAARGISPAYVFSCETVPVDYFGGLDTSGMHLVAFSCISPVTLRRWRGGISFYNWMLHSVDYDRLWERAGMDLGFVATGNIITTQAVAFSLGCGVASLILVGNDLAFSDTVYAGETEARRVLMRSTDRCAPVETAEFASSRRRREYEVRRGDRVYFTNSQFLAAKLWLEDLLAGAAVPVYDCGEPDCSAQKVKRLSLQEYLGGFDRARQKRRKR